MIGAEEELPSEKEYANGRENLKKSDYKVDYIITHTCPIHTVESLNGRHDAVEELILQNYLEWVSSNVIYNHWWFGHWHVDRQLQDHQTESRHFFT